MVMSRRSVNLVTLFSWASLTKRLTITSWVSGRRRMIVENIPWSISTKGWDWAKIKLTTPGSAISLATYCTMEPGVNIVWWSFITVVKKFKFQTLFTFCFQRQYGYKGLNSQSDLGMCCILGEQGSHRPEKYLNIQDCLKKSLKIIFALKSTGKKFKGLEKSLDFTIYRRIQHCLSRFKSV